MDHGSAGRRRFIQLVPDGPPTEVIDVPFRAGSEEWCEYLVDDGTVVRIRLIVTDILRVVDSYDAQGQPNYLIQSSNVTSISAAEDLCRKPEP